MSDVIITAEGSTRASRVSFGVAPKEMIKPSSGGTPAEDNRVQMRQTARTEEFAAVAGGYRLEIERMQAEEMEYLLHPPFVEPQLQLA